MKCPKCGYLGYERVDRCRNCGYDFSLASSSPTPELRLRDTGAVPQPLDDLELIDAATPAPAAVRFNDLLPEPASADLRQNGLAELPLFGPPITDDVPLITKASPPRPPLAVRRATPEVPRLRSDSRAPLLEYSDPTSPPPAPFPRPAAELPPLQRSARANRAAAAESETERAGFGARAVAAAIDVALLAIVDVVIVYFTMKICRLTTAELALLPKAPLITFLLLQNGGYFVAFTTIGQTLGKMVTGLRVLADDAEHAPDLGRSAMRALVWMVLALPAGLGLLTAVFSRDGRGLHDRFAGTRVVRAGA
jgi:resuscitation-promoting factor RpfA